MAINCKMCGTSNEDGVQFCAACGSEIGAGGTPATPAAPRAGGGPAKTMMFGQAPQVAQPAAAAKKEAPKTMLGMPAVTGAQPAQQPAPAPQQPAQPPAAQPQPAAAKKAAPRTVLGMPAVTGAQPQQAPPAQPAQPAPMARPVAATPAQRQPTPSSLENKKTMLGMPAMTAEEITSAVGSPPPAEPATVALPAADRPASPAPAATPIATPAREQPRAASPATTPLEPVPVRESRPEPAPQPSPPPEEQFRSTPADSWPDDDDDEEELPRRGGGSGLLIVAIIAGVVVLAGAGLLVYLMLFRGGSDLQPQVFPSADGQNLTVVLAFPAAPPGAAVQVQGQVVQVLAGQARFELPLSQMQVGQNQIQVIYSAPGAAPETLTFPIVLRHTTTTDLTGLITADPFIVVNFQVAPGIRLAVNGQPAQLVGGTYAHRLALSQLGAADQNAGDTLLHKLPFQLTDEQGHTEQGQHVVSVPVTRLQIDRPANGATVALDSITCSGTTEEGAQVTVNGEAVGVTAVGFSSTVSLSAVGQHQITVNARAPGKAPRTIKLAVTRIQSLDTAIEAWAADVDRSLDYPNLARDANVHVGKKLKISGRVVNINTEKGVTAFLLYVGDSCPAGARCAVYVVFRGETDAGLQSLVDVYGTVKGTRDVTLRGGDKETMPALDAEFVVLSAEPKKKHKRR